MAENTKIAWTRSSFNPWIGCTKVSPGCDHCYAEAQDARGRWDSGRKHWGVGVPRYRTSAENWHKPITWNKKAAATGERWLVFCASLADVFDNEVPPVWRHDLWKLIQDTPALTWLLLTKRIGNVAKLWPGMIESPPPNVWLGASVVNQEEADRDIPKLVRMQAAKRFVSYEPALGPVDFSPWLRRIRTSDHCNPLAHEALDWIIVGGESGSKARPFDVSWARSTVSQCKAAGVPVFVKQLGSQPRGWCAWNLPDCIGQEEAARLRAEGEDVDCVNYEASEQAHPCFSYGKRCVMLRALAGDDPAEWPEDLRVQEFPA